MAGLNLALTHSEYTEQATAQGHLFIAGSAVDRLANVEGAERNRIIGSLLSVAPPLAARAGAGAARSASTTAPRQLPVTTVTEVRRDVVRPPEIRPPAEAPVAAPMRERPVPLNQTPALQAGAQNPSLQRNIEQLRTVEFNRGSPPALPNEISVRARMIGQLENNPRFEQATRRAWDDLHNSEKWRDYTADLMRATEADVRRRGIPAEMSMLENGELSRTAVLRVLVQRSQQAGEPRFTAIRTKSLENEIGPNGRQVRGFRDTLARPFFDLGFRGQGSSTGLGGLTTRTDHGVDSHLIQRDFLRASLNESMGPGQGNQFYEIISRNPNGLPIWDKVFDSFGRTMTSPEHISRVLRPFMPIH